MFKKILIANRGEIAIRIIRACKEYGILSAAIFSEADQTSEHVKLADESYLIGPAVSSASYLNKEKIIELAIKINADAIHPGYGFLSENSDFINAVEQTKITFIGPSSSSAKLMGNKTKARDLMKKNNVPIVPGSPGIIKNPESGIKIAEEIGYPVLLKASAGGGGKGMRKINSSKEFTSVFESTGREALKAFGNDDIYIEKYIENPKHIEVQVIADKFGNFAHLFERECSIQRRHQKIIEEAPSPFLDSITRERITGVALDAAKACDYYNAGTIEFLMDEKKNFYFLEMNTRLQVEHPVTEFITGIDLVKEQISIAAGNKLSFKQDDLRINGHSIECRIYAEDPSNNFLPSTGEIFHYKAPSGNGVRVDSGFSQHSEISIYYDPLISKLICWAKTRDEAICKSICALNEFKISGVINNINYLVEILNHRKFKEGMCSINFIEDEFIKNNSELKTEKEIINISALTSALLKNHKSDSEKKINSNKWIDLRYE
jgi:acetyl-CoA carboxylase biotin carboxylase subunit